MQDFVYYLGKPSHHSAFFNKEIQRQYEDLRDCISSFIKGNKEDENSFYVETDKKLKLIIDTIKIKSA